MIKNKVVKELTRLNLMGPRVPYTYHHDYIRTNVESATYMSRADVANLSANEDELWACAFLQAIAELSDYDKICNKVNEDELWACAFLQAIDDQVIPELSDYDKICNKVNVGLYSLCYSIAKAHVDNIQTELNKDKQ